VTLEEAIAIPPEAVRSRSRGGPGKRIVDRALRSATGGGE
jgi:hypothetical protein